MEVHVLNTREEMGKVAGKAVEEKIMDLLSKQEEIRMIFAAAPSQNEFLAYLCQSSIIPWNRITAFHMDEYIGLPADASQLFSNFLKRNLFDKVPFKKVHLMNGNLDVAEECSRYSSLLSERSIDIVCMGIGENGHIAFNDPPVADFNDPEMMKKVELDHECRQQQVNDGCFATLDKVPKYAVTLTVPALMSGRYIYCIVPGENKKKAVHAALDNAVTTECPASILKKHSDCKMYLDEDAYGKDSKLKTLASFEVTYGEGLNCISGKPEKFIIRNRNIEHISALLNSGSKLPYVGPGLVDLQVNGVNGVDFNDTALTEDDVVTATKYLLSTGVTTYFPTVITNSESNILKIVKTISGACDNNELVDSCVGGIHLEGPFLSGVDGARGAHNEKYLKAADWQMFERLQEASGNRIKIVTLAPECEGSFPFIKKCKENDVHVAIGHSNATTEHIEAAVKAGASLSTHLGNAVPLMLPRHPNLLWDQLAQDDLYASIIADGFHLPDSFLKVVIKTKGDRTLLVSDATCFSGMAPGTYQTHIGDEVILNKEGRLALSANPRLLAGATKTILENIQYLLERKIAPLDAAWKMGSINPAKYLGRKESSIDNKLADRVQFQIKDKEISIEKVIKNGRIVYEKNVFKLKSKSFKESIASI
jgi:glucosamine-6-phosphate deaminase